MLIYLLFGILIAAFVITFGPQSGQKIRGRGGSGCSNDETWAAKVNGSEISEGSFRYGILALTGGNSANSEKARQRKVRENVLDQLIVRELLAQAAEDNGFRLSDDEVLERIARDGEVYVLGLPYDGSGNPWRAYFFKKDEGDTTPHFSSKALSSFAQQYTASVDMFVQEQKRELLAQKMKDLVLASVRVAPEEARARYEASNDKIDASYVLFASSMYEDQVTLGDADLEAYAKAHDEELKKQFERDKDQWTKRPKEVRLRDIVFKKKAAPPAPASQPAAASQPVVPAPDDARKRADAALARLKKGEDFAAVARAVSEDAESAKHGGLLYWRAEETLPILGQPVADALAKLEPGQGKGSTSDVLESPEAFHIYQLVERREGDIPYEKARRELAEKELRQARQKEMAKAAATKAVAAAKGGTPLDKQFPPDAKGSAPKAQKATGVTRTGNYVAEIGESADLAKALYEQLPPGDVAGPFEVSDAFIAVKLEKHDKPDLAKFETEKLKLMQDMARQKAYGMLRELAARRCEQAKAKGQLSVDKTFVEYAEAKGKAKTEYTPCSTFREIDLSALADDTQIEMR